MASVTLPGASGGIVTVQSGSGDHIFVAQIIANTILLASVEGGLNTPVSVTVDGSTVTAPPPTNGGKEDILYLTGSGGGTFTIPTGYEFVVDLMTGPETIVGSNVEVISDDQSAGQVFSLSGASSIAAMAGTIPLIGTANLASGNGNDTVSLTGAGTIDGGAGANLLDAAPTAGGAGIRIQSDGTGDTVNISGPGTATVLATGSGASITDTGFGTLDAFLEGTSSTLTAGTSATDVTISGAGLDNVVLGGTGPLSVVDQGTGDTIAAINSFPANVTTSGSDAVVFGGSAAFNASVGGTSNTVVAGTSSTLVTLSGSSNFFFGESGTASVDAGTSTNDTIVGGSGPMTVSSGDAFGLVTFAESGDLTFLGGNGAVTIVGGSGNESVSGGAGGTTLFGGAGSEITYTGSVGQLDFSAGAGNETLDASGSSTNNLFWGGQAPSEDDTLIGGTGNDTFVGGAGADSMVGNVDSRDWFVFIDGAGHGGLSANDTVTGFSSNSTVWLANYGPTAAQDAINGATTDANGTTISLSDGTTILFTGVTSASQLQGHIISN